MAVKGGRFATTLGQQTGLVAATFQKGAWIGAAIGGDQELQRKPVLSVPFALRAAVAEGVECSGCVDGAKAIKPGSVPATAVGFSWAAGESPGGSANYALAAGSAKTADAAKVADSAKVAQDLQCTGCVGVAELKVDAQLDLAGFGLKTTGAVAAKEFVGDGSKLTGIAVPKGGCVPGMVVSNIKADGTVECAALFDGKGKVSASLMPFSAGDLIALGDRPLIEGLAGYATANFSIAGLGEASELKLGVAKYVKAGVKFGPGGAITGAAADHDDFAWWVNPALYDSYDDFNSGTIDAARWAISGEDSKSASAQVFAGDGNALYVFGNNSMDVHSKAIPKGHHLAARFSISGSKDADASFSVGGCTVAAGGCKSSDCSFSASGSVLVRARQDGKYDIHLGTGPVCKGVTMPDGPRLQFEGSANYWCCKAYLAIDSVVVSRYQAFSKVGGIGCDDANPCTWDYVTASGCIHTNHTLPCNDGSACTSGDTCTAGKCIGAQVTCNDNKPYTADGCDKVVGCTYLPCASAKFDFTKDGAAGWTLKSNWTATASGLTGKDSTDTASSPLLSPSAQFVRLQYDCLTGGDSLTLNDKALACTKGAHDDIVDLGSKQPVLVLKHIGAGTVVVKEVWPLKDADGSCQ